MDDKCQECGTLLFLSEYRLCEHCKQARIEDQRDQALDHLRALLAVDTWAGLVGSAGQRCRTCWGLYPDHKADCARDAAQTFVDGLGGE